MLRRAYFFALVVFTGSMVVIGPVSAGPESATENVSSSELTESTHKRENTAGYIRLAGGKFFAAPLANAVKAAPAPGGSSQRSYGSKTSSGKFGIDKSRARSGSSGSVKTRSKTKTKGKRTTKKKNKTKKAKIKSNAWKPKIRKTRNSSRKHKEIILTTRLHAARLSEIETAFALRRLDQRFSNLLRRNIVRLEINGGRSAESVAAQLAALPDVDQAAPNSTYALQGGKYQKVRFAPRHLNLHRIHQKLTGKAIRVAVIDTAIETTHPALTGVWIDQFDGLKGRTVRQRSHGTAVAGLIAGRGLFEGPAPNAHVLIARAFDGPSSRKLATDTYTLLTCLDWAADQRSGIVNMSFAGPANEIFKESLAAANLRGIVLIAAAGNKGPKAAPAYPAAYDSTIAVTAIDVKNRIYRRANRGDYVFISAPGVDILAPAPGKSFDVVSGTSFAAALVTGVIALAIERFPSMSVDEQKQRLQNATTDLGKAGFDQIYGHGLVDVSQLVAP